MPFIKKVIDGTKEDAKFLESMSRNHERRLLSSIRKLRENIISTMDSLERTPSGKLLGAKVNLKQSQKIHKQLINQFEKDYGKSVDKVLGDFSHIEKSIKRRYKFLDESIEFTSIDKDMMDTLKINTYNRFKEFGDDARNRIARAMYDQVAGGAKFSTLVNTITGVLTGHKDVVGRPMTMYAKGFAQDAVMNYHNQVNIAKGEAIGMKHFLYYGDIIATSRPFCITRVGKVYTKPQILAWDKLSWQGKAGSAFTERGGYNCRHHWRPVRKEWVTDDETGDYISENEMIAYMNADSDPRIAALVKKIEDKEEILKKSSARTDELKAKYYGMKGAKGKEFTAKRKALYAEYKEGVAERKTLRAELKDLKSELAAMGAKLKKTAKKKAKKYTGPKVKKPKAKKVAKPKEPPTAPPPKTGPKVGGMTEDEWKKADDEWAKEVKEIEKDVDFKYSLLSDRLEGYGIRDVVDWDKIGYAKFADEVLEPLDAEIRRLGGLSNDLSEALRNNPVTQIKVLAHSKTLEDLSPDFKTYKGLHGGSRIALAGDYSLHLSEPRYFASHEAFSLSTYTGSRMSTFRHELGHHIHSIMDQHAKWYDLGLKRRWKEIWDDKGSDWFKKKISEYAGTNVKEAFAESFAIYFSKNFKKNDIPDILYDFFEELRTGKKKKLKVIKFKKPKVPKSPPIKLAAEQKEALKYATDAGKWTPTRKRFIANAMDITTEELDQLIVLFNEQSELAVRRKISNPNSASFKDIFENGKFKNQFELGENATSSGYLGSYKHSARDRWERNISGGALQRADDYQRIRDGAVFTKRVAKKRPIYGFVRDPLNPGSALQYGEVEFVLHPKFKKAASLTNGNSSAISDIFEDLGTFDGSYAAFWRWAAMIKDKGYGNTGRYIREMLAGQRKLGGWAGGRSYVEAQIYGGIDLNRGDVLKIVVRKNGYDFGGGASHIEKLANKYNIPIEYKEYGGW